MRVMYVTADDWIDNGIRFVDGGAYSHCALVFGTDVVQAVHTGVEIAQLHDVLGAATKVETFDIPVPDEAAAEAWARQTIGHGYDYLAIAILAWRHLFGTSPRWDSSGRYFCDELVLMAGIVGGMQFPDDERPRFFGIEKSRQYLLSMPHSEPVAS